MKLLALLFVVAAVAAKIIDIKKCDGVEADKCTIHEIRITPCKNQRACVLTKGEDAAVAFEYTPHFSASKVKNTVIWNSLTWDAIGLDACQYTPCPVQDGNRQTYNAILHIGKKLPEAKFEFRWSVFDENNSDNACCFKATVQLRDKKK